MLLFTFVFSIANAQLQVTCNGKQYKVESEKMYENIGGTWTHVGDRCINLVCKGGNVHSVGTDGSLWRYNGKVHDFTNVKLNTLNVGEKLNTSEKLISENGAYMLHMQNDGNLCVYKADKGNQGGFVWGSMKYGFKTGYLEMQTDGNLVVYDSPRTPKWNTETTGVYNAKWNDAANKPVKLVLENDGKIKLYNAAGNVVWNN